MTPEGKVKRKISAALKARGPRLWYFMPVPSGFGGTTVDYIGCFIGQHFVIEAKRPGKEPTERQLGVMEDVVAAGGTAFAINDDRGIAILNEWLDSVEKWRS